MKNCVRSLIGVIHRFLFPRKSLSDKLKIAKKNRYRFPLLHLHYVAIREVLDTLDPIDLINFSKVSKSCRMLSTIKKPYKIKLTLTDSPAVVIKNVPMNSVVKWTKERRNIAGITRSTHYYQDQSWEYLCIYSESFWNPMREYFLYARSVMATDIDSVWFFMGYFKGEYRKVVYWLRSMCREIPFLRICGSNQRHKELQFILDHLKVKDRLYIYVKTVEQLPLRIQDTIRELKISCGSWITLNYVMSLKMSKLGFRGTHLTNQDLNVIYKNWIEMKSHQNLECFDINLSNREDFVAVGLRDIPYRMGLPRQFPDYIAVEGSFEVIRKDGLTASICVYQRYSSFVAIMHTRLPDLDNFFPFFTY